jgi:hypothetical protein
VSGIHLSAQQADQLVISAEPCRREKDSGESDLLAPSIEENRRLEMTKMMILRVNSQTKIGPIIFAFFNDSRKKKLQL